MTKIWWEDIDDEELKEIADSDFNQELYDFQNELLGKKTPEFHKGINPNIDNDYVRKNLKK